jgi:hypothetical protein
LLFAFQPHEERQEEYQHDFRAFLGDQLDQGIIHKSVDLSQFQIVLYLGTDCHHATKARRIYRQPANRAEAPNPENAHLLISEA